MTATPSAGRPRDSAKDAAVLEATRQLLTELGYQGTTMVAVARRANVGTPTIYRRWPTKEALIEEVAFGHLDPAPLPLPTGDIAQDLRAWVEAFLNWLAGPVTRAALPGLLMAYHQDTAAHERLIERSERGVRLLMTELIIRDLPELPRPEAARRADSIFDLLVSSTVVRAITRGHLDHENFCTRTAHALTTLARAPQESAGA